MWKNIPQYAVCMIFEYLQDILHPFWPTMDLSDIYERIMANLLLATWLIDNFRKQHMPEKNYTILFFTLDKGYFIYYNVISLKWKTSDW